MRKIRLLSIILIAAVLFNSSIAFASASENTSGETKNTFVYENYALLSFGNSNYIYNIFVDSNNYTGSFAIIYSDNPNYLNEYTFTLSSASTNVESPLFWEELVSICFSNSCEWETFYLPTAISSIENSDTEISPLTSDADLTYFINYIDGYYGSSYTGKFLRSTTIDGLSLKQYESLEYGAYKNITYYINQTMTAASVITTIIGIALDANILAVIGGIATAGGLFSAGTQLYEYTMYACWSRYIAVNDSSEYYMADKMIRHTGYVSSETGGRMVDPESARTEYAPSQAFFDNYSEQFQKAYNYYI